MPFPFGGTAGSLARRCRCPQANKCASSFATSMPRQPVAAAEHVAADPPCFTMWSMRMSSASAPEAAAPEVKKECIVCYEDEASNPSAEWFACSTCTAMWCGGCFEQMYNAWQENAREEDHELACPQCRGSIASMQRRSRMARITAPATVGASTSERAIGATEAVAEELVAYEDLLTEVVRVAQSEAHGDDGKPYFKMAPAAVARVMSRDVICDIVDHAQSTAECNRLQRRLRSEDYGGAFGIALDGYAAALRRAAVAEVRDFVQDMAADLAYISEYYFDDVDEAAADPPANSIEALLKVALAAYRRESKRDADGAAAKKAKAKTARGKPRGAGGGARGSRAARAAPGGARGVRKSSRPRGRSRR